MKMPPATNPNAAHSNSTYFSLDVFIAIGVMGIRQCLTTSLLRLAVAANLLHSPTLVHLWHEAFAAPEEVGGEEGEQHQEGDADPMGRR